MITAILAQSRDNVIGTMGKDGPKLPWHIPEDLKHFKRMTLDHTIIMGRTTFDSIGKPLPKRRNIVVSTKHPSEWGGEINYSDSLEWASDPAQALEMALSQDPNPFIIGGGTIYSALWDRVQRVELTKVDTVVGLGLVFGFDPKHFDEVSRSERFEHEGLGYEFVTLERRTTQSESVDR